MRGPEPTTPTEDLVRHLEEHFDQFEQGLRDFNKLSFKAFIGNGTVKVTRRGQLAFTVVVPSEYVDDAFAVRFLATNLVPIQVDMNIWEPYARQVAEDEERAEHFRRTGVLKPRNGS